MVSEDMIEEFPVFRKVILLGASISLWEGVIAISSSNGRWDKSEKKEKNRKEQEKEKAVFA